MDKLRIVAQGNSDKAQANARGKLFEKIVAEVLRHYGYEIDQNNTNITQAGMEIDIDGKAKITGIPLYAECKCYTSDVNSNKLQTFFGKYMTRWFKDRRCQGLFVALPGINSHAKGFYRENCTENNQITLKLLQESDVLSALIETRQAIGPNEVEKLIAPEIGSAGDKILICSDQGFFWLQYVIPIGAGIATKIKLFDSLGNQIIDRNTQDYLSKLIPEISEFEIIADPIDTRQSIEYETTDQVVELRGSSTCFEYQFPASPDFFVGRDDMFENIQDYIDRVIDDQTSSRGILFEANSGWGKSSLVLAMVERITRNGHYALAIDSRSASSSQFILKTVQHVIEKFGDFDGALTNKPIVGGFDGAVKALLEIGHALKNKNKLLFIFLDQFENIFYLLDLLVKIAQLSLKITDERTNIVIGFSWKTDLIGLTREFPYRWRDMIIDSCKVFRLKQFSEVETNALLDRLGQELHTTLRKDLRFFLSEFSQGYPWLLKKLCAHVKNQKQKGLSQAEIARGLLNVEQLFSEDIEGLSGDQEEALRRIARLAPVSISDLSEEFKPQIVQSLVNRRLIVKVGIKYDIYWDIFRDYLNTGKLPIEDVYLLRTQVGSILRAVRIINQSEYALETKEFKNLAGLSDGAFLNVARDLRLLQLARIEDDHLHIIVSLGLKDNEIIQNFRKHLNDRLLKNRCVYNILRNLRERGEITLGELAVKLKDEFPYISAVENTWKTYARVLATWLDVADLAVLDQGKSKVSEYKVGSQIRDRSLSFAPRRSKVTVPSIHFSPIVQVATRLVSATQKNEAVDWAGISRSTIYKSLSMLEEMKLVKRKSNTILITSECINFVFSPEERKDIARKAALNWPTFETFISILKENETNQLSHQQLGKLIINKCNVNWKPSTAKTNAKIMLDWARNLEIAHGVYAHSNRGKFKRRQDIIQIPLFNNAQ
ncbi:MAG: AAA-associated domain-containing protein [Candidatus Hodarchaeales archaeon]